MPDYYYTNSPASAHDEREFAVELGGVSLSFFTDAGVFSKDALDPGSRLLIESAPPLAGRVLDLGCGWGPVGAFLAGLNPGAHCVLSDVNERAVGLARRNCARNGITNAEVVESDGFAALDGTFDAVITNPPIRTGKQTIYALFDESLARLNEGGVLLLVIRKQQGAPSALKHLRENCPDAEVIARDKGYWIIQCKKTGGAQA